MSDLSGDRFYAGGPSVSLPSSKTHSRVAFITACTTHSDNGCKRWKGNLFSTVLLIATTLWLVISVWVSFAAERISPPTFIAQPEFVVVALSFLSGGSMFLLGELVLMTFEHLRWTLSSRQSGVDIGTFLGISRATCLLGVLKLNFSKQCNSTKLWCLQRMFFFVVRILIGQLLLINLTIVSEYIQISDLEPITGGIGAFNASLVVRKDLGHSTDDLLLNLFTSTWGFLGDRESVSPFPPSSLSCRNSQNCLSVTMPGRLDEIFPSPLYIGEELSADVSYVVDDIPSYQFEFDVAEEEISDFEGSQCRRYYVGDTALAICAKTIENALIYGWSVCPDDIQVNGTCLSSLADWYFSPTLILRLSMFHFHSTTRYSLSNSSILAVDARSPVIPLSIPPEEILSVLDFALQPSQTTHAAMLMPVINDIQGGSYQGQFSSAELNILRNALALIITQLSESPNSDNSPTVGYKAKQVKRVLINPASRYLFTTLSLSLLIWCLVVLIYCWTRKYRVPNTSYFPEIDFAKNVLGTGRGIPYWLMTGSSGSVLEEIQGEKVQFGV